MKNIFIAFLLYFSFIHHTDAQVSWRKSKRAAESAEKDGKFAEAAALYEAAWKGNNNKTKLIYQAGELYAMIRDYQHAADCYKVVKDDSSFPLAKLYYARALKQCGLYEKAISEYASFISNYGGGGADKLRDLVQIEIRGCEFGLQSNRSVSKIPVQITRPGAGINSNEAEFGPIAFGEDILYFSSNVTGRASIYRSQKQNGMWSKAVKPTGFPEFKKEGFCNGSFSPDNSRFYFTECTADKGLQALCVIYVMNRVGEKWSEPQKLPASINYSGFTSTHPSVASINGKEFLFFSSNKPGGKGGMDIYNVRIYSEKKELTFGIPVNLGENVNSEGDEITPFFDSSENTLYFSSNANLTVGGLDIQKSKLLSKSENYGKTENVGLPYNSAADDYYFVKSKSKNSGFLVSNRAFKDKNGTTNEDIFEFSIVHKNPIVKGKVFDKNKAQLLADSRINLFEITTNGQKRLLNTKVSKDGSFDFNLLPDKKFRIDAEKQGYYSNYFEVTVFKDSLSVNFEKIIELEAENKQVKFQGQQDIAKAAMKSMPNSEKPVINAERKQTAFQTEAAAKTDNKKDDSKLSTEKVPDSAQDNKVVKEIKTTRNGSNSEKTIIGLPDGETKQKKISHAAADNGKHKENSAQSEEHRSMDKPAIFTNSSKGSTSVGTMPLYETKSRQNEHLITSAPKHEGTYYKIQIIALKRFDYEEQRYDCIRELGRADTEYIVKKDMVRVLLADFFQLEDAQKILLEVRKNRAFSNAFIVQYVDGVRF